MSTLPATALAGPPPVAPAAARPVAPRPSVLVGLPPGRTPGAVPARAEAPRQGAVPGALRDIETARARIDLLLEQARRGRTFSPQELLCLQADSHRFAQAVELAARTVEHGVQGLRQALQSQV
ncbi:MAG: hypothetical protein WB493_12415 [Anaeromyxobacteraceae bacterium]